MVPWDADAEIVTEEGQFRFFFDEAPVGALVVSEGGEILEVNEAFCRFLGRGAASLRGRAMSGLYPADEPASERLGAGETRVVEQRYVRGDGRVVTGLLTCRAVRDASGRRLVLAQVLDIEERKQIESQLQHDALHDRLTGLADRVLLLDRLEARLGLGEPGALLVLGVDRFVRVNERHGHGAGDRVLIEVARRLEGLGSGTGTVARVGADEFAILLGATPPEEAAAAVQAAVQPCVVLAAGEVWLTVSIGVRPLEGGERAESALRDAMLALRQAKALGGDQTVVFQGATRQRLSRESTLRGDLRGAIEQRQLEVHYQEIRRSSDQRLAGFEALLRWRHPVFGPISPAEFIPMAESDGLILPMGEMVLGESLAQLGRWRATGPGATALTMAVNLSTLQLRDRRHVDDLCALVRASGVPPEQLTFELTESVFLDLTSDVQSAILSLKATGARLSLDDFGTGWSSLSYLHALPFDGLKLDRSFVLRAVGDERSRHLVSAIAALARSLELRSVAEGVETDDQRRLLLEAGYDYLQGFFYARPAHGLSIVLPPPPASLPS
jgi:diguanylate cyclase (GGDEF)-like protein/PAS domain S-box-containing protein